MKARTVYRSSCFCFALLAVLNLAFLFVVWRRLKRPVNLTVDYHEPTVISLPVNTNTPPASIAQKTDPAPAPSASRLKIPRTYHARYRYFEVGGKPFALLHGRYLEEGSLHAYGGVVAIYPERIYFDGGDFIENRIDENERVQHERNSTAAPSAD